MQSISLGSVVAAGLSIEHVIGDRIGVGGDKKVGGVCVWCQLWEEKFTWSAHITDKIIF